MRIAGNCVPPTLALLLVAGCARYESQTLDLHGYMQSWPERVLEAEEVCEYARLLVGQGPAAATPFSATDGLTLAEAEAVALHFNPKLRAVRAAANVPLASAREAGWWPDPEFEAEVMRFVNRGSRGGYGMSGGSLDGVNSGVFGLKGLSTEGLETTPPGYRRGEGDFIDDPWIVGASLSITIPVSGRLALEENLAWSEYSAAWRRILIAEWELVRELHEVWLEWSTAHEQAALTRDYLGRMREVAQTAARLAEVGELRPTEARVLLIEHARRRVFLQRLEAETSQRRLKVLALLGVAPGAPVELLPERRGPKIEVAPDARSAALLKNHPRLGAVRADYETAERGLRLEIRKQFPDLTIGPSYSLEEGFSRMGFGFGFPLPLWNRNRRAIAEATAARDAARMRAQAEVEATVAELAQAEARLDAAADRLATLADEVAPLVDQQVQASRRLLELGETDVLVLREAMVGSLETKLEILDASLAEALAADALRHMLQPRWVTPSQADPKENE